MYVITARSNCLVLQYNVVKDQRFETNIPTLIRQLETFMEAALRDYYFLDIKTGRFENMPEFPKDAWFEGIVNALCHRSYNRQGNCIYIKHFDDRLEISNSGPLPAQVTVENIKRERYSRNPQIARVLIEMGYVRELNEGVPRIYDAMRDSMLSEPIYKDLDNTVTLILLNKVSEHKQTIYSKTLETIQSKWKTLNRSQRKIINLLYENQKMSVLEFRKHIELTEQAIRYNLRNLIKLEIVERLSDKTRDSNAIYQLLNE